MEFPRVLLVDDDPSFAHTITAVAKLAQIPLHYCCSTRGLTARMLEENDVIICDFEMPTISGVQLAKVIARTFPKLPLVLISAYTKPFRAERPAEVSLFITKYEGPRAILDAAIQLYQERAESDVTQSAMENGVKSHAPSSIEEVTKIGFDDVLNPATLKNLEALNSEDNPKFLQELFLLYLQHGPAAFFEMENRARSKQSDLMRSSAHRLKGLSFNLGATKLVEACQQIEEAGRNNDWTGIEEKIKAARHNLYLVFDFISLRLRDFSKGKEE